VTWPAWETPCPINKSSVIEVCLQIPDLRWSILIDEAVVQWVKGNRLGLSFVSVRAAEGVAWRGLLGEGHCEFLYGAWWLRVELLELSARGDHHMNSGQLSQD
jgi:hypothetical protein